MNADLRGKVVVVTGAHGAAGPAVVSALTTAGATVVAPTRAEVDLSDEQAVRRWRDAVLAEHARVDGLLHLVGGWRGGKGIVGSESADWTWLQDRLVVTLQHTTRAFHDALRDSGGRLAIVSSSQAQRPTASNAAYAAAKAAAEAWTLAVAHSWRKSQAAAVIVQVKAIGHQPGFTPPEALAERLVDLLRQPAEINGTRVRLDVAE